uniref:ParA family protein n=1 Tax=Acetatifactor sp. TaxID=1872090 RepID=UPI004057C441
MTMANKGTTTKFISIVSGKGGTGKSLFTAVLGSCLAKENCKVLLVDMDIYVRGLTILLSSYMDSDTQRNSICDYLNNENNNRDFAVYRFQECEFIPAVREISEPLAYSSDTNFLNCFSDKFFADLKEFAINKMYDIVLLDCRSGLDVSITSCVKNSDFVFAVTEDDDVCLNANQNLVNYFRHNERINNIYTIINKGRRISSVQDIKTKIDSLFDFSCIGVIPFDEQIMDDYGKERFWLSVYDTLYFSGLVMTWEKFQTKTKIQYHIDEKKYSIRNGRAERNTLVRKHTSSMPRLMKIYGYAMIILSGILQLFSSILPDLFKSGILGQIEYLSVILIAIGIMMVFISSSTFRRLMLGKSDDPTKFE